MTLRIDVHLYVHQESSDRAIQKLDTLIAQGVSMSEALNKLTTEVTETKEVMASAVTLITGLADQIRELKDDPAALEGLATSLDDGSKALAAAVAANTPAAPSEPV